MLKELKEKRSMQDMLSKKDDKIELTIEQHMDFESISEIIATKLNEEIKKNVC